MWPSRLARQDSFFKNHQRISAAYPPRSEQRGEFLGAFFTTQHEPTPIVILIPACEYRARLQEISHFAWKDVIYQ